jgi:hypothetical protein
MPGIDWMSGHDIHQALAGFWIAERTFPMLTHLLARVRDKGAQPRVHGNGFIQLDISPIVRLHVWNHPGIPQQRTPTTIHDHRFGFTSVILRGKMLNRVYHEHLGIAPTHAVYESQPRIGEDTELTNTGLSTGLVFWGDQHLHVGESYIMRAGEIHESLPQGFTVTMMMKHGASEGNPGRVFVPNGVIPDNCFDRNHAASPAKLWEIIAEAACV